MTISLPVLPSTSFVHLLCEYFLVVPGSLFILLGSVFVCLFYMACMTWSLFDGSSLREQMHDLSIWQVLWRGTLLLVIVALNSV